MIQLARHRRFRLRRGADRHRHGGFGRLRRPAGRGGRGRVVIAFVPQRGPLYVEPGTRARVARRPGGRPRGPGSAHPDVFRLLPADLGRLHRIQTFGVATMIAPTAPALRPPRRATSYLLRRRRDITGGFIAVHRAPLTRQSGLAGAPA
jgi:hypothetical protein